MDYNKLIHDKYLHAEIKGYDKHHELHGHHHHHHHRGNKIFAWIMILCCVVVITAGILTYILNR